MHRFGFSFETTTTGFTAKLAWSETELKPTAVLLLAALLTPLDEPSVFLGETSLYIEPRTSSVFPIVLFVLFMRFFLGLNHFLASVSFDSCPFCFC